MSQSDQVTLSQDEVYDLLSNARRRFTISYLREHSGPVAVSDLSQEVAAWENDVTRDELTDQQVKRVYVSLYQTHLPKLSEVGIVDYDQDAGRVELTSSVSELDTYLPEQESAETSWQMVYVGVALVGLALYAVATLVPSVALPLDLLGVATILTFAAVAIVHYLTRYRS